MKPITVFEHKGIYGLSDANKRVLDHLRGPRNERLFEVGWSEVRATSFVGVVQLPQVTLQILPKMHRTGLPAAECEHEATLNLLFLLSYTRKLDVTEPEIALLTEQRAPLSEILYWIFARRLWEAVQREVLRGYVTHEARLGVMKGRWLVAAQCRRSDGWRRDLFDVAYDEFTEDNLPNRLFKATVEWLSRRANWSDTQRYLTQLRAAFTDVTDYAPRLEDFTEAVRWMVRYRRRAGAGQLYRPLLNMARMFFTGAGPQLSLGKQDNFAFLFDMNQLFEEFIAEFVRRELRDVWESPGWTFHAQKSRRALLCDEESKSRFWLRPDVRFESADGDCPLIVDTKYKRLDISDSKAGVTEADAYQMFAYKECHQCPRVVLLYPESSDKIARDFSADSDTPPWLEVRTVNLKRDLRRERKTLENELRMILSPTK